MGDDGKPLEVAQDAAMRSKLIKDFMDGSDPSIEVLFPVPDCNLDILTEVFEYCEKTTSVNPTKIEDFKKQYVKRVDGSIVTDLVRAANYLKIKDLVELLGGEEAVSDGEQDMPVGPLKDLSDLKDDFPPVEGVQELRELCPWAFIPYKKRRR